MSTTTSYEARQSAIQMIGGGRIDMSVMDDASQKLLTKTGTDTDDYLLAATYLMMLAGPPGNGTGGDVLRERAKGIAVSGRCLRALEWIFQ